MPTPPGQETQDPLPSHDKKQCEGAYGARVNRLFRDALRDLETLKQSLAPEKSN